MIVRSKVGMCKTLTKGSTFSLKACQYMPICCGTGCNESMSTFCELRPKMNPWWLPIACPFSLGESGSSSSLDWFKMPLRSSTSLLRLAQKELLMYRDLPSFTTSRPNLCSRRPLDDSSIHLDLGSGPGPSV